MGEFGRISGGQVPKSEDASNREHLKQVGEDIRHERIAGRFAKAHRKRPWWKFWARR